MSNKSSQKIENNELDTIMRQYYEENFQRTRNSTSELSRNKMMQKIFNYEEKRRSKITYSITSLIAAALLAFSTIGPSLFEQMAKNIEQEEVLKD
ncbi:MAG: hypothetical protein ACRCTQ_01260 [Brevinemataceae bacterium]